MKNSLYLHRFAIFTALCTLCLIVAGGLVTSTQSGLAVPDWPLSYGQLMPPMVGGIFYEHGHRMIATFVGFLTTILALWLWRAENRRWVRTLGFIALAAVIIQGLLGGITVLFLLPTAISVSHATLAQTFFSIVSAIALFTSPWWKSEQPQLREQGGSPRIATLSLLTTGAIFLQLILGALMRHTQSGLAVPDFPLAFGQLFPSLTTVDLARYNEYLIQNDVHMAADGPITAGQIAIHMTHRIWAVVVSGMIIWLAVRIFKHAKESARLVRFSIALLILLAVQVTLGVFTVLTLKSVEVTTAHVATGALLLGTSVLLSLHAVRLSGMKMPSPSYTLHTRRATA